MMGGERMARRQVVLLLKSVTSRKYVTRSIGTCQATGIAPAKFLNSRHYSVENPNPKKYMLIVRRGKAVLVDKQILRWRKKVAKLNYDKAKADVKEDTLEALKDIVKKWYE